MNRICPLCGREMKRNGKTSSGRQRWRCKGCGASSCKHVDNTAKLLSSFLDWLFSKKTQSEMSGGGRTFRRKTSRFWRIWAMPPKIEERHRVVYLDGIYLARKLCVLIACTDEHVIGWHLCRSENSGAWGALISRIAAPHVAVSDGGSGLAKALKKHWPKTKMQRCVFHAFCQVKRYTTTRPRLQAGTELYGLSKALLSVTTLKEAERWAGLYFEWVDKWAEFLEEETVEDGRRRYVHERLRKARGSLSRLVSSGSLFTYLDPALSGLGELPATNNRIEGAVNAQIRDMLRNHRGLDVQRRAKAVFWWCYMHSPHPLPPSEILRVMPTDESISAIYQRIDERNRLDGDIPGWGDAIVWSELHHAEPWRMDWD